MKAKCIKKLPISKTISDDIRCMNMTLIEAINLAEEREGWRDCVARRAEMHGKD